jgi:hypothetical protein
MRRSLLTAGVGLVFVLTGCSAARTSAAAPATVASRPVPPGCSEDLAAIQYPRPSTEDQANADETAMEAASHSQVQDNRATLLASEAAAFVGLAAGMFEVGGSPASDLKQWNTDVAQIRSYCG